jgi:hypothetical protein
MVILALALNRNIKNLRIASQATTLKRDGLKSYYSSLPIQDVYCFYYGRGFLLQQFCFLPSMILQNIFC